MIRVQPTFSPAQVLLWSLVIPGRKHTWRQVLTALLVACGCFLFAVAGGPSTSRVAAATFSAETHWGPHLWGALLIMGYLGADGLTSIQHDQLFRGYAMSSYHQAGVAVREHVRAEALEGRGSSAPYE
jgi:drug/metabolite transporter (DMT)-like permease